MLLAGRKLNAVEACDYGLVTEVFPQAEFESEVDKRMKYLAGLPPKVCVRDKKMFSHRTKTKIGSPLRQTSPF